MTTSERLQRARRGAQYSGDPPSLDAVARRMRIRAAQKSVGLVCLAIMAFSLTMDIAATAIIAMLRFSGIAIPVWLSISIGDAAEILLGLPLAIWIMSPLKPMVAQRSTLHAKQFLGFFSVAMVAYVIGTFASAAFSFILPTARNAETELMEQNPLFILAGTVILAPIIEEWVFRKQVISRLERFGQVPAILTSSLLFALMHQNLFQLVHAFVCGLVLGYVYVRTHRLIYTIALHMTLNFFGSLGLPYATSYLESGSNSFVTYAIWTVFGLLAVAVIVGVVLIIRNARSLHFDQMPEQIPPRTMGSVLFGNAGMILFLIVTALLTAASLTGLGNIVQLLLSHG
ncbi:CAAX amino protease [Bifidobacterium dolichotidis]|uniref:CAAX amino protease n=1 Tax=Bifidobacterium dolichotidis TaxID=2306976 RepID=A0A430FQK7_9BIFI|nr:type II CAAX endopeptidase family protein [Bifidobacterium dolichotidis]RSX55123.1 CAAX amino protease [Bifidobacterium dolichotidis]